MTSEARPVRPSRPNKRLEDSSEPSVAVLADSLGAGRGLTQTLLKVFLEIDQVFESHCQADQTGPNARPSPRFF